MVSFPMFKVEQIPFYIIKNRIDRQGQGMISQFKVEKTLVLKKHLHIFLFKTLVKLELKIFRIQNRFNICFFFLLIKVNNDFSPNLNV